LKISRLFQFLSFSAKYHTVFLLRTGLSKPETIPFFIPELCVFLKNSHRFTSGFLVLSHTVLPAFLKANERKLAGRGGQLMLFFVSRE